MEFEVYKLSASRVCIAIKHSNIIFKKFPKASLYVIYLMYLKVSGNTALKIPISIYKTDLKVSVLFRDI